MLARNQCGSETGTLGPAASTGVTPPLLPTLVVAVVLAAASVFCPETRTAPAAPETPVVRMASAMGPPAEAPAEVPFVPASLAFPLQFPITAALPVEAATRQAALPQAVLPQAALPQAALPQAALPAHRTAARMAARNRPAPARGAQQVPAEPASMPVVARAEPVAPEAEDGVLPALALPFAPTIRVATQAASFVGAQSAAAGARAVALGDAVVGLVGGLR